jgi:hypothetical protein
MRMELQRLLVLVAFLLAFITWPYAELNTASFMVLMISGFATSWTLQGANRRQRFG